MRKPTTASAGWRHRLGRVAVLSVLIGGALLAYLWLFGHTGVGIPCFIRTMTGFSCGSCGLTRALEAVLRADWCAAFGYHPLWLLYVVYGLWVLLSDAVAYVRRGICQWLPSPLWVHMAFAALMTVFGVARNIW